MKEEASGFGLQASGFGVPRSRLGGLTFQAVELRGLGNYRDFSKQIE